MLKMRCFSDRRQHANPIHEIYHDYIDFELQYTNQFLGIGHTAYLFHIALEPTILHGNMTASTLLYHFDMLFEFDSFFGAGGKRWQIDILGSWKE